MREVAAATTRDKTCDRETGMRVRLPRPALNERKIMRSGYSDACDMDQRDLAMWRGRVASAIRGKRGTGLMNPILGSFSGSGYSFITSQSFGI